MSLYDNHIGSKNTQRKMKLSISPVQADDVDLLVRKVELPAHQDGPLHRLMFPLSTGQQLDEREAEIRWTADGLRQAVQQQDEILYKACGDDGLPAGFIGWTVSTGISTKTVDGSESIQDYARGRLGDEVDMKKKVQIPPSLDVSSRRDISKRLREERQRVFEAYRGNRICRITFMAVDPNYQRQGVGSALMDMFCRTLDESELDAFVMSSPTGVRLYSKFGFKAVAAIETKQGNFTSMLRLHCGLREQ